MITREECQGKKGLVGIFEGMTTVEKTRRGVMRACMWAEENNYTVFWGPPDYNCDFDFLICKPNEQPKKVQVKTSGQISPNGNSWIFGYKSGNYSLDNECMEGKTCRKVPFDFDIFFGLDADGNEHVLTRDEATKISTGKSRLHSITVKRKLSKAKLPL
tara:strand:+ start:1456 stop:1932 length:477 start_codon:yes stop_codon:yes gene_type:complete